MGADEWTVFESESGQRLQAYLHSKLAGQVSSKKVKLAIENNGCTVNGKKERFSSYRIGTGDRITLNQSAFPASSAQKFFFEPLRILYEDEFLIIYDKPHGINSEKGGVYDILRKRHPSLLMVHRLDKETSGAIIYAKTALVQKKMIEIFRQKKVVKEYLAITAGVPNASGGIIDKPMGKLHDYQGQSLWGLLPVKKGGVEAITKWHLLKKADSFSLIACAPITGRTHQIRVHLNALGCPILGDKQYGRSVESTYFSSRHLLHALKLSFPHPTLHSKVSVECSLPGDFKQAMRELFGSGHPL